MELYDVEFRSESVGNIKKKFDYVSHKNDDMGDVTGDAKYYTLVRGKKLPPAQFATIAEYIWLLGKTNARQKFLVFGNDIAVPDRWLATYGDLLEEDVIFYFMSDEGKLQKSYRDPSTSQFIWIPVEQLRLQNKQINI